jgi:hypothetical protein
MMVLQTEKSVELRRVGGHTKCYPRAAYAKRE